MEIKKFVNKVRQISTGSYLLRLEDNRSEMPKSEPTVIIKGNGYGQELTMTVAEAKKLTQALKSITGRFR